MEKVKDTVITDTLIDLVNDIENLQKAVSCNKELTRLKKNYLDKQIQDIKAWLLKLFQDF